MGIHYTRLLRASSKQALSSARACHPQPVPVSHHGHTEEFPPNTWPKPALFHFKTTAPCPLTISLDKKSLSLLFISSLKALEVSPKPSLLQSWTSQLSQPVLIGEVLQPSDLPCGLLCILTSPFSCARDSRAACSIPGGVSGGQSRWGEPCPSTCWPLLFWCSPESTWPELWDHTVGSCPAFYPQKLMSY